MPDFTHCKRLLGIAYAGANGKKIGIEYNGEQYGRDAKSGGACLSTIISLVDSFWKWTGYEERYKVCDISTLPIDPVDFPLLHEMRTQCDTLINQALSPKEIDAFLVCMAVDNEAEWILDACKKSANNDFLETIVSAGVCYPQMEVRWQIAELLRRNIPNRISYLTTLLADAHPYVRKRAYNVWIDTIDSDG